MLEFRFDTQLLIEGHGLDEDAIHDYIQRNIAGDCLLAVGDEDLIKIHFHTNTPWKVLEYCAGLGDIHDVVIENMERQENMIMETQEKLAVLEMIMATVIPGGILSGDGMIN